jgi:hypothetical protein
MSLPMRTDPQACVNVLYFYAVDGPPIPLPEHAESPPYVHTRADWIYHWARSRHWQQRLLDHVRYDRTPVEPGLWREALASARLIEASMHARGARADELQTQAALTAQLAALALAAPGQPLAILPDPVPGRKPTAGHRQGRAR